MRFSMSLMLNNSKHITKMIRNRLTVRFKKNRLIFSIHSSPFTNPRVCPIPQSTTMKIVRAIKYTILTSFPSEKENRKPQLPVHNLFYSITRLNARNLFITP